MNKRIGAPALSLLDGRMGFGFLSSGFKRSGCQRCILRLIGSPRPSLEVLLQMGEITGSPSLPSKKSQWMRWKSHWSVGAVFVPKKKKMFPEQVQWPECVYCLYCQRNCSISLWNMLWRAGMLLHCMGITVSSPHLVSILSVYPTQCMWNLEFACAS